MSLILHLIFLVSLMFAISGCIYDRVNGLIHGTYVAGFYGYNSIIIAADSRGIMGEAKLEYCKIVPLSKSKVFAAIGATRYIEGGEIRHDAGDTAKAASFATDSSASTLTMAELWKNWTITNIR